MCAHVLQNISIIFHGCLKHVQENRSFTSHGQLAFTMRENVPKESKLLIAKSEKYNSAKKQEEFNDQNRRWKAMESIDTHGQRKKSGKVDALVFKAEWSEMVNCIVLVTSLLCTA